MPACTLICPHRHLPLVFESVKFSHCSSRLPEVVITSVPLPFEVVLSLHFGFLRLVLCRTVYSNFMITVV